MTAAITLSLGACEARSETVLFGDYRPMVEEAAANIIRADPRILGLADLQRQYVRHQIVAKLAHLSLRVNGDGTYVLSGVQGDPEEVIAGDYNLAGDQLILHSKTIAGEHAFACQATLIATIVSPNEIVLQLPAVNCGPVVCITLRAVL